MAACCSRFVPVTKYCCVKVYSAKNFRHCYLGLSNSCWTIFLGSSPKSLPFSHVLLHNSLRNLCWICLVGLRWEHSAITTWIFDSVNCWCIKGLQCCISMTRSKLSWLHGLFGDDILITRQHFVFSEKHVICFSYKSHDFAHLCDFVTKFGYAVWSAWKYYSMCGI